MGQLCDAGCVVTFNATTVRVHLDNMLLLSGVRTRTTGLWHLSLVAPDPPPANATNSELLHHSFAAVHSATPAELVAFAHAALFSPAISTLKRALDCGFLPNFLGLTAQALAKHPPNSFAMVKGHMDQTRKNQQSTKPKPNANPPKPPQAADEDDAFPPSDPSNSRTHHCFAALIQPATGQIHTDQTGKFIVASNSGNNYMIVLYDYDSNSILVESMQSCTRPCILATFKASMPDLIPPA